MNKVIGIDNSHLKRSPVTAFKKTQQNYNRWTGLVVPDAILMICIGLLMLIGLVIVASASIPKAGSNGWVYSYAARQLFYMTLGLGLAFIVYRLPMRWWHDNAYRILLVGFALLVLVITPGISREVNGAMRWISVGPFNLQVSEFVRICMMVYAAAYLQRYQNRIHKSLWSMVRLLLVLGMVAVLLLMEPDFGSTVVIGTTVLGMMFLAGVCLVRFAFCTLGVGIAAAVVLLAAPYRRARLATFIDPWQDMYGSGYQLVNSLIAIGRGETTGVGIGESLEKHHYLPEAHTDFIFSILAEEAGLLGVCVLLLIFAIIVWRAFVIANNADKVRMRFASCLAYGIGLWVGMQALINMSVASGLLPTKGLTLPMISYGGSSVLASMILFAILLRIDSESRYTLNNEKKGRRGDGMA
ncbi:MAG: putative lipid II flippase FtsW [Gammaproteobacteria bacterium]|nr:MAG: putative lipid II flippase FtsW [Gammaproteobacteria bacterium]